MVRPKVLVSHPDVPEDGVNLLKEECDVVLADGSREGILKAVQGVDGIFWFCKYKLDREVIDAAGPLLRSVSTMSAGYDHIDVRLLKERGIPFGNTPRVLDKSVADTAVALVLSVARRTLEGRRAIEQGTWVTGHPQWMLGVDVTGCTVGIVGFGGIGQAFAKRMKAFDIGSILYCGNNQKLEASALGASFVPFDKLIETSDVILISCPSTPQTRNLFNASVFKKMKSTAILVNVGRGDIIDQEALVEALKSKQIWGAGLDVMYPEPLPADHPLISLDNCVLFPHIGSATIGTRSAMAVLAAKNVLSGLKGLPMPSPV